MMTGRQWYEIWTPRGKTRMEMGHPVSWEKTYSYHLRRQLRVHRIDGGDLYHFHRQMEKQIQQQRQMDIVMDYVWGIAAHFVLIVVGLAMFLLLR